MGIIDPTQYEKEQEELAKQRESELDNELDEVRSKEQEVPEKYKGKSLDDLIQMHEEAERKASRLGNEVGQLRQQVQQRPKQEEEPKKKLEVNVDTLLENPEDAIEAVVNQSPVVKKLNETVETIERDAQRRKFEAKHKDFQSDLQNEQFFEWIKANPLRVTLAQSADQGDFQAADYLWDMWAEVKTIRSQAAEDKKTQDKQKRDKQLQDGMLESGTGNTVESKKVFRRSEIRDLKTRAQLGDRKAQAIVEDPVWQQEVMNAYAQKRVV